MNSEPDPGDSDPSTDSDPPTDSGDEPPEWVTLAENCDAPSGIAEDPLISLDQDKQDGDGGTGRFLEALDVEVVGDQLLVGGQGGLLVYDISDPTAIESSEWMPSGGGYARWHRVEPVEDGLVAVTNRDEKVALYNPTTGQSTTEASVEGAEGMAWVDEVLYVAVRGEGIYTYEIFSGQLAHTGTYGGPENTWELSDEHDGYIYAADNVLGVVPIDVSGDEPVVGTAVELDGAVLHVFAADDGMLYASLGGNGVAILDATDPAAPALVSTVRTGGSAVMTSAHDGVLWVADHDGIAVFDVSDPANPAWIHREITEQFALAIHTDPADGITYVGDWNIVGSWQLDRSTEAPALDAASDELVFLPSGEDVVETVIHNRGAGTLELTGLTVDSPDFSVRASTDTIPSGESATLEITYSGTDDALQTALCLASNDPGDSTLEIPLMTSDEAYIGREAYDFTLSDLEGNSYTLSDYRGHPVVLIYFATW